MSSKTVYGLPTNKLPNLVVWAEKPALGYGRAFRPTPQQIAKYFLFASPLANALNIVIQFDCVKTSNYIYWGGTAKLVQ